jgi:hypothetical protein
MADNDTRSYRNRDSVASQDADLASHDPLEELARLIGQSDFGRDARVTPSESFVDAAPVAPEWPAEEGYAEPEPYEEEDRYAPPQLADAYPGRRDQARYDGDDELDPPAGTRYAAPHEDHADAPRPEPARGGQYRPLPALAPQTYDDEYQDDEQWQDAAGGRSDVSEDYYEDERPRLARRGGVMVLAVVGVVLVVGAASAFAYREIYGGSILPTLPPIIKAGEGPNKIIPAHEVQAGTSGQSGATDAGAGEKLLPREEQPVTIQPPNVPAHVIETVPVLPSGSSGSAIGGAASAAPPSSPWPATQVPPPLAPVPAPAQASASPPAQAPAAGSTEPKKIHTVSIRPEPSGAPRGAAAAPGAPTSIAPATTTAPAHVNATPQPVARVNPAPAPRAGAGAPLAIVPIAQGEAAPVTPPRSQVVRAEPRSVPLATTPTTAPTGGGYAVQVTSQRTEAEAKAAFRSLRSKFPEELGKHEPIIRRAELGDKGTFYRALVGPFASEEAATQMCSNLKAAGGSCLIQRN